VIQFPSTSSTVHPFAITPEQASAIRLLVLDIDGTISGINNTINPAVQAVVQAVQRKGIQVAIATGRMFHSAARFYEILNLDLPLMAYQGALIKEPKTGKVPLRSCLRQRSALRASNHPRIRTL
jgi:HAD superfamily hydrolase (TIGR01484 family)